MKPGTLSPAQSALLARMTDKWQSAHELGASLGTLNALKARGKVERRYLVGACVMPREATVFRKVGDTTGP